MLPHFYCVSSGWAPTRRANMQRRFQYYGLSDYLHIVEAIPKTSPLITDYYGRGLWENLTGSDREKKLAETSCFASHIRAIRQGLAHADAKSDSAPWWTTKGFIIIEDDVLFHNEMKTLFPQVLGNISPEANLINFCYIVGSWSGMKWVGLNPSNHNVCDFISDSHGCVMYWISHRHAIRAVEMFDREFSKLTHIKTTEAITLSSIGNGGYLTYPILAMEDRQPSLIEDARNASHIRDFEGWGFDNYTMSETKEPEHKCTFVTALFDLGSAEKSAKRRSAQVYLKLFEQLAQIRHPLVVFVEEKHKSEVTRIIDRYSPKGIPRSVITRELCDLPYYGRLEAMTKLPMLGNPVGGRDTYLSSVVTCSKSALVAEIATANPFTTTHFGWIDMGIHHLQYVSPDHIDCIVMNIPDLVKVGLMCSTHPNEIKDRAHYYQFNRGKVVGTLYTGNRDNLILFDQYFRKEFDVMIQSGHVCLEEQIMGALVAEYPDFFDYWFCDYVSVLSNYVEINHTVSSVLANLVHCQGRGLHKIGLRIGQQIISSLRQGRIKIEHTDMGRLLYNLYICAYYTDRTFAKQIGETIVMLFMYNGGMGEVLSKYDNLGENLGYLGLDLKTPPYSWEEFLNSDAYSYCYTIL